MVRRTIIGTVFAAIALGLPVISEAAEADVTSFSAYLHSYGSPFPIVVMRLEFSYTASWSDADRFCYRELWLYNNNDANRMLSNGSHTTNPTVASGSDTDSPQTEATGRFYRIWVWVRNSLNPNIIYATDYEDDGDWY